MAEPIKGVGERVIELAGQRKMLEAVKQQRDTLGNELQVFMEQDERFKRHAAVSLECARRQQEVEQLEKSLREFAAAQYDADDPTVRKLQIHPAVKIIQRNALKYDPAKALAYCQKNLTSAVTLDKGAFEAVAKTGKLPVDVVEQIKVSGAQISSDLSMYV